MVTVLEKGTKPIKEPTKFITKCKKCGCKFTYDYEDIILLWELNYGVACPQCEYIRDLFILRKYRPKNKSVKN